MKHRRLQELDRSDFAIVKGDPDIRGWDVKLSDGKTIGEVEELILDAQARQVRYMVVELEDDNDLELKERKVLMPIGLAELDKEEDDVILPNVRAAQLKNLPTYNPDHLTPEVERRICEALGRRFDAGALSTTEAKGGEEVADPEFYRHEYYNLDNLYRHRMHEARPNHSSEYEQGLRLWEMRSEGGIIEEGKKREFNEEERREMVRSRRQAYEERRRNKNNTIIDRIKNEGLRDAR